MQNITFEKYDLSKFPVYDNGPQVPPNLRLAYVLLAEIDLSYVSRVFRILSFEHQYFYFILQFSWMICNVIISKISYDITNIKSFIKLSKWQLYKSWYVWVRSHRAEGTNCIVSECVLVV